MCPRSSPILFAGLLALVAARPALAQPDGAAGIVGEMRECEDLSRQYCIELAVDLAAHGREAAQVLAKEYAGLPRAARLLAAYSLGQMTIPEALPVLRTLLAQTRDDGSRMELAQALVGRREDEATPAIEALLADDTPSVRALAATALGKRAPSPTAAGALLQAAADESAPVRAEALTAAGLLGVTEAAPVAAAALGDEDAEVRQAAAVALQFIGDDAAVWGLIDALSDPEKGVRVSALVSLHALTHVQFGADRLLWRSWYEVEHPDGPPPPVATRVPHPAPASGAAPRPAPARTRVLGHREGVR